MNQNLNNSEYATEMAAALDELCSHGYGAPFRIPVSISRRRLRRRSAPIAKLGFFEAIDRREATGLVRAQAYRDEYLGIPVSPEDAIIDAIDAAKAENESPDIIFDFDDYSLMAIEYDVDSEFNPDEEHPQYENFSEPEPAPRKIRILSDSEEELVAKYMQDPFCDVPLRDMRRKAIPCKPSQAMISKIYDGLASRNRWIAYLYDEAVRIAKKRMLLSPSFKLVECHPVPELVDADEQEETLEVNQTLSRWQSERWNVCSKSHRTSLKRHRGQKHRRYNIDRATPRYERWKDQLPFYSMEVWIEDNMQEAFEEEMSARESDEDMEAEHAGSTEEQFQQYLNEAEREIAVAQAEQCIQRELEIAEEAPYEIDAFDPYLSETAA